MPADRSDRFQSWEFTGTAPPANQVGIAFGIERLGLLPLRFPIVTLVIVIVLAVLAGFGLTRIKVDDSLSQLFRSDTAEFRQYEALTKRFPSSG